MRFLPLSPAWQLDISSPSSLHLADDRVRERAQKESWLSIATPRAVPSAGPAEVTLRPASGAALAEPDWLPWPTPRDKLLSSSRPMPSQSCGKMGAESMRRDGEEEAGHVVW